MDVVYLDSKAFDTVSHSILVVGPVSCGLDKWPIKWMENSLGHKMQRGVINDTNSSWWLVSSGITQGLLLRQTRCNNPVDLIDCTLSNLADNTKLGGSINMMVFRGTSTSWRNGLPESSRE